MIKTLALFVTLTAAAMTAVAAWDRGGTDIDKALLVAMSVVIVLAVHLLPALSRRPVAWLVWSCCLLCAIYGHLTFLTHASLRAADARSQNTVHAVSIERQIATARESLAEIKARPVATVAAELAQESDRRVRAALRTEIVEGQRAARLRDDLARLQADSTVVQVAGTADPVAARLAVVTGWTESGVSVVIGMAFAMLLELIGALLWFEALRPRAVAQSLPSTGQVAADDLAQPVVTEAATDHVTQVTDAIKAGRCMPTVAGIREYLKCGQTRAMEIRRVVSERMIAEGVAA
jgi:hypothetical protein